METQSTACDTSSGVDESSSDDPTRRGGWFYWYVDRLKSHSTIRIRRAGHRYACPCCAHLTLEERGGYAVCPVCFWEDDGQDDADARSIRGGPNGLLSLTQARANYQKFGASDQRHLPHVRLPIESETPSDSVLPPQG